MPALCAFVRFSFYYGARNWFIRLNLTKIRITIRIKHPLNTILVLCSDPTVFNRNSFKAATCTKKILDMSPVSLVLCTIVTQVDFKDRIGIRPPVYCKRCLCFITQLALVRPYFKGSTQ